MAIIYPSIENIKRLRVQPTEGEWALIERLRTDLNNEYEVFFNSYLDGDRPDFIVLKKDVGAFIIEVKDWALSSYSINEDNTWKLVHNRSTVKSPHAQAFKYKKNLYDLHLPILGIKQLSNNNFFNVVYCFVYFHKSDSSIIQEKYRIVQNEISRLRNDENDKRLNSPGGFNDAYQKRMDYLSGKIRQVNRDKSISFGNNQILQLIGKIKNQTKHILFTDEIYDDFKRRLSPPEHTKKQGIEIKFDKKQTPHTISEQAKSKVKGVAGCGKTSILAQRALNAYKRSSSTVLILTFNITLKNHIRDKISDYQGCRDFEHFEISNYHQFFNSQVNNTGQDLKTLIAKYGFDGLYKKDIFSSFNTLKYNTILLDEIQDYEPEWGKIIRDNV